MTTVNKQLTLIEEWLRDNRSRLSVITFVGFAKIYNRILLYICGICELELLGRMPQTFPS